MARFVIALERVGWPSDASYRFAFWLTVPAARQAFYANPTFVSAVVGADAPDAGELAALRSGAVVERVEVLTRRAGDTLAALGVAAKARCTELQAEIDARNDWDRYGTNLNGATLAAATWTAKGVA